MLPSDQKGIIEQARSTNSLIGKAYVKQKNNSKPT